MYLIVDRRVLHLNRCLLWVSHHSKWPLSHVTRAANYVKRHCWSMCGYKKSSPCLNKKTHNQHINIILGLLSWCNYVWFEIRYAQFAFTYTWRCISHVALLLGRQQVSGWYAWSTYSLLWHSHMLPADVALSDLHLTQSSNQCHCANRKAETEV